MFRALIIDDSKEDREPIARFLSYRKIDFDIAESPAEAWRLMEATSYNLVFLDMDLGGGYEEGIGILAWMEQHGKRFPTVIASHLAHSPGLITLGEKYGFVRLRLTQAQISGLAGLLDDIIAQVLKPPHQNMVARCVTAIISVLVAGAGAFLIVWLRSLVSDSDASSYLAFAIVAFAVLCALVNMFGESIAKSASDIFRNIMPSLRSLDRSHEEE